MYETNINLMSHPDKNKERNCKPMYLMNIYHSRTVLMKNPDTITNRIQKYITEYNMTK